MNKILIAVVALIVGVGAFIFLGNRSNPSTQQPESTSTEKDTVTEMQLEEGAVNVTLSDARFTPKDITVKTGTKVVWTNSSGKAATVNSDDHPTHQLYPFLNLGEFADGSSVQVVFDKAGKYTYHNHLNASQTGTVIVE